MKRARTPVRRLAFVVLLAAVAAPCAALTRYIAFGDSITEGVGLGDCDCECPEECGYPVRLERFLQLSGFDATVENHGLGGERTAEGLSRIDEVLEGGGDVLLLMEGTNDVSARISPETTLFNLEEMALLAADRGLSTVHATLIPRAPQAVVDPNNELNRDLARGIRELAVRHDRQLADPFEVFSSTPDLFEDYYWESETDPVGHPNSQGFALLTTIFFDVLTGSDEVPPVLGPVEPAPGAEEVPPLALIRLQLYDFGSGIDPGAIRLQVNGANVGFARAGDSRAMELFFIPDAPLPSQVTVNVEARDRASPANSMSREATTFSVGDVVPMPCEPSLTTLCIDDQEGDRRFAVDMTWETALNGGLGGDAVVTPLEVIGFPKGGMLSFFEGNPEVLVKVLNGCGTNGHYWVFGAATTTLAFDLVIRDTLAQGLGASPAVYEFRVTNEDGDAAPPFFDIEAFDTCDFTEPSEPGG